jgi:hypothetical protein
MWQGENRDDRAADPCQRLLLQKLPGSRAPVRTTDFRATRLDPDGGTGMILYRKDRVQCAMGQEHLEEHRLTPASPTRRVVATCCNSAMFADFTKGHWLSLFRNRFTQGAPPLQMRVMTQDRPAGVELAGDVPNYEGHSGKFMLKLFAAWMAMGFRTPRIAWGRRTKPAG